MTSEIPVVSDEIIEQVNRIFAHGGQRAKSHDQRFGQYLINKIRETKEYKHIMDEYIRKHTMEGYINFEKNYIECKIWNMENPEFLELVKEYND